MARVELSGAADADLEDIFAYSIETFGLDVAVSYADSFNRAFALLEYHPRAGRLDHDIDPPIYSLPNRGHRIFYDIEGDRVIVQRILHKAQDPRRWLP